MDKQDKEFIRIAFILVGGVIVLLAGITLFCVVIPDVVINYNYCETQQALMPGINFEWVFWGGCLLEAPDGTWVNASDYLSVERLRLQIEDFC